MTDTRHAAARERIECTDEDGALCGWVEVDPFAEGVMVEVIDASHEDGEPRSAVTYMSVEQARALAAALLRVAPEQELPADPRPDSRPGARPTPCAAPSAASSAALRDYPPGRGGTCDS